MLTLVSLDRSDQKNSSNLTVKVIGLCNSYKLQIEEMLYTRRPISLEHQDKTLYSYSLRRAYKPFFKKQDINKRS